MSITEKIVMDNIIQFPKHNFRERFVPSEEQVEDKMTNLKHYHINETLSHVIPNLFLSLENAGFDLSISENEEDIYFKDGAIIVEAVRALMCKYYGIKHPVNYIAENLFTLEGAEEGTLRIVDKIDVDLRDSVEKGNSEG